MTYLEAHDHADIYVPHSFDEHVVDVGEVRLNYAVAGDPGLPALLLIPAQSESWWGYERAMPLLAEHFQAFAVDLRGQGRSTWTPGRYTLDTFGGDLVRFIDLVIGRPTIVAGLSSGGTIAAWLSAFAKPGQVTAGFWEDPPLFASEGNPAVGQSIRQGIGPMFALWNAYLGDQWSVGDWDGLQRAIPQKLPLSMLMGIGAMFPPIEGAPAEAGVPQNLKEYDPEWGKAFASGAATASCDHANMISAAKVPVLLTQHFHQVDEATGTLVGAMSDLQATRAGELVTAAGQDFTFRSFPEMPHAMHLYQPALYTELMVEWAGKLGLLG
jgi:pimeloyl-ACP methyl ester carboxylesterase